MVHAKQKHGSDELVTKAEAAKLLCVPPRAVSRLVERGILEPVKQRGTKMWFDLRDLSAASDALDQKLSFSGILEMSTRAHTAAARVERKLNALLLFFGFEELRPQVTKPEIEANELRGQDLIALGASKMTPSDMMMWARTIMRVDDNYLRLSEYYLRKGDPWVVLLTGTNNLIATIPVDEMSEPDTAMAVSMLSHARKHLISEAYNYCRYRYGKKIADMSFPDKMRGEMNDIISALIRT